MRLRDLTNMEFATQCIGSSKGRPSDRAQTRWFDLSILVDGALKEDMLHGLWHLAT